MRRNFLFKRTMSTALAAAVSVGMIPAGAVSVSASQSADLSNVPFDSSFADAYDAVTSASTAQYTKYNNAWAGTTSDLETGATSGIMTYALSDSESGTYTYNIAEAAPADFTEASAISGISGVNIRISKELYNSYVSQSSSKSANADNAFSLLSSDTLEWQNEVPAEYKTINADGSLSATTETTKATSSDATAYISSHETTWGDYLFDTENFDEYTSIYPNVQGIIIEDTQGNKYGLKHVANTWINAADPFCINVNDTFLEVKKNVNEDYLNTDELEGKTIKKVTFQVADGADVVIDDIEDGYVPYLFESGNINLTPKAGSDNSAASATSVEYSQTDDVTSTVTLSSLLPNSYSLKKVYYTISKKNYEVPSSAYSYAVSDTATGSGTFTLKNTSDFDWANASSYTLLFSDGKNKYQDIAASVSVSGIKTTGITVGSSSVSVAAGSSASISGSVTPSGSSDSVTFTSNDESIATVSYTSGRGGGWSVTGVKEGTTTLNATAGDYTLKDAITVTVSGSAQTTKASVKSSTAGNSSKSESVSAPVEIDGYYYAKVSVPYDIYYYGELNNITESSSSSSSKVATTISTSKKSYTVKASAKGKKITKKASVNLKASASSKVALTYKVTKKASDKISVSKSGVVTFKKGAKIGTYKIKITAKAKGKYKKAEKTVTIKLKKK